MAPLPDGRLQLWAVGEAGQLFTTYNTRDVPWVPWENFLAEVPLSAKVLQVEVAPLPDKRLQLWAVSEAGQLFSTWKLTPKPDEHWEAWKDFLA